MKKHFFYERIMNFKRFIYSPNRNRLINALIFSYGKNFFFFFGCLKIHVGKFYIVVGKAAWDWYIFRLGGNKKKQVKNLAKKFSHQINPSENLCCFEATCWWLWIVQRKNGQVEGWLRWIKKNNCLLDSIALNNFGRNCWMKRFTLWKVRKFEKLIKDA